MKRKLFCEISPLTYRISTQKEILMRKIRDLPLRGKFARVKQKELLPDTVKNLTARLTKWQDPYDNSYIIRKRMFRDRQREQRSAGSPRKGNWIMAALRMNGGEEKEEKAMEFTGKQIQEARERIAPFVD